MRQRSVYSQTIGAQVAPEAGAGTLAQGANSATILVLDPPLRAALDDLKD
jgi:hypothetical protein